MNVKVIKRKGQIELRDLDRASQKQELKSKGLFYLSMGVLTTILIGIGVYLFWILNSSTVLEIKNAPVPVRPTTIDKEQYVLLHYDYCKHSGAEGKVESSLVSKSTVLNLPTVIDNTKQDCNVFDAPYPVPGQTPPDTYHYKFKACYPLNPIKESCTEWESKEFVVEGPEPPKEVKLTFKK